MFLEISTNGSSSYPRRSGGAEEQLLHHSSLINQLIRADLNHLQSEQLSGTELAPKTSRRDAAVLPEVQEGVQEEILLRITLTHLDINAQLELIGS